MRFDQFALDSRLLEAITTAGFVEPTPIQERAIPVLLEGRDVIGLAQTGTGKTAAFGLPILHRLLQDDARFTEDREEGLRSRRSGGRLRFGSDKSGRDERSKAPSQRSPGALIVAPTRELAEQIRQSLDDLARYTKIRTVTIYGGVSKVPQTQTLRRGVDIVVACPGRLLDIYGDGSLDLSQIHTVVLDEADHMLDMGFLPDVRRILQLLPKKRQTLLFSATMPTEIRGLASNALTNPEEIRIGRVEPAHTVSHGIYEVRTQSDKTALLVSLLEQLRGEKVLVFTRTKHRAKGLAQKLKRAGHRVSDLQGNMAQNQRDRAIAGFKGDALDVMVATDIAARGIDVAEIAQVINFDMTNTVDAYTHRIGRTGRAQKTGRAVTFVVPEDREMLIAIERLLKSRIERLPLPDAFKAQAAAVLASSEVDAPRGPVGRGSESGNGTRSRSPRVRSGGSTSEGRSSARSRGNPAGEPRSEKRAPRNGQGAGLRVVVKQRHGQYDLGERTDRSSESHVFDLLGLEESVASTPQFGRQPRRRGRR